MKQSLLADVSGKAFFRHSDKSLRTIPEGCLKYSEKIAVVERAILPSYKGRIRFQGSSWLAQCERPVKFEPGERVVVIGRHSLTLMVDSFINSEVKV